MNIEVLSMDLHSNGNITAYITPKQAKKIIETLKNFDWIYDQELGHPFTIVQTQPEEEGTNIEI